MIPVTDSALRSVDSSDPADARLSSGAQRAALAAIYVITLALSLHRLDLPLLEFYPVRQIQTADITRTLYQVDWNILKPVRYNGSELKAFILEFPLYNAVAALGYAATGGVHESIGRLVSVAGWLGAGFCLYVLVRRYFGDTTALVSLFFFHMSRIGIQVSRSFSRRL